MHHSRLMASALAVAALLAAIPTWGQDRDTPSVDGELSGELTLSKVIGADLSATDSEDIDDGSSTVLRGSLDYDLDFGATDVSVSYDSAAYFYEAESRSDRWSNRLSARAGTALSNSVEAFGAISYGSNLATAESGSTDQLEVLGRLQFIPSDESRLRVFGGYRWRDYDADGSEGRGAFAGAQYRYRFAANHYLTLDARRENIESDAARRGYDRTSASLFYQIPVADDLRLTTGLTARWWDFDMRFVPDGRRLERRSFTPEIELQYATRPGLLLRGRMQYIVRDSIDPQFAEDQGRAVLTAGYRF